MLNRRLFGALTICALAIAAGLSAFVSAWASAADDEESLEQSAVAEPAPYPGRLKCKAFPHPLDGSEVELPGSSTDGGRWVSSHASNWQIYTAELVVGQKSTGFPIGWLHVCLRPL